MKFGQVIVYNMRNIFLELLTKRGEETIPRPCSRELRSSISLDQ